MAENLEIKSDPNNPTTVILSRWPDESEKDQDFRDTVQAVRSNPDVHYMVSAPYTGQDGAEGSTAASAEPDEGGGSDDPDGSQDGGQGADDGHGDQDPEPDPEGLKCHLCDQPAYKRKGDLTKHINRHE